MSANDGLAPGVEYKWNGKEWAPVPKAKPPKPTPSVTTTSPYKRPIPYTTTTSTTPSTSTPTRPNSSRVGNASVRNAGVSQARVFSPSSGHSMMSAVTVQSPTPASSLKTTNSTTSTAINQTASTPSRTISNNKATTTTISNPQKRNLANALILLRRRFATGMKVEPSYQCYIPQCSPGIDCRTSAIDQG